MTGIGFNRDRKYDLLERLIEFGLRIMAVVEELPRTKIGNHVGGQMARSGTSPAPLYAEALGAESRADFIHKMRTALKELRETWVWLIYTRRKPLIKNPERLDTLIQENSELIAIFVSSVNTATRNKRQERFERKSDSGSEPE